MGIINNLRNRQNNIDILKAICAFYIVCIHVPFPGIVGEYLTPLTRIAVPIFFMITGYFYADMVKKRGVIRQIKKIIKLVIEANIIYLVWKCFYSAVIHNIDYFKNAFILKNILKFILLNESPFSGHLWYLSAILYVLIIVLIANKLNCNKLLYWFTPILLLCDLILGKYSIVIWGREFPYILVRNFLFVGIPCFCIGHLVSNGFGKKIGKSMSGWMILLFSLTSLLEHFILISVDMNATRDHYISTTFLAVSVFIFTLKCNNLQGKEPKVHKIIGGQSVTDILAIIGRKYSTGLYILHPIFITCIGTVANEIGFFEVYRFIAPIVVYFITILFLVMLDRLKKMSIIMIQKRKNPIFNRK